RRVATGCSARTDDADGRQPWPRVCLNTATAPDVIAVPGERPDADEVLTLQGPVERFDGKLALAIPLDEGGDKFLECCRRTSEVQGIASRSRSPNAERHA